MRFQRFFWVLVCGALFLFCNSGEAPAAAAGKAREYQKLSKELSDLVSAGKYAEGAEKARALIKLAPALPLSHISLAGCLAKTGKTDEAFASLEKAADLGFNKADAVAQLDELAALRTDPRWSALSDRFKTNQLRTGKADPELQRKITALGNELMAAIAVKNFLEAEAKCEEMIQAAELHPRPHLLRAVLSAQQNKKDEAFAALNRVVELGFEHPGAVEYERNLAALRDDPRFAEVVGKIRANMEKGAYEKGKEIPKVKTVEGYPEGVFRYRLRMNPDATPDSPDRLVLWFHPAGASGNSSAEGLLPILLKNRFALTVITAKSFAAWQPNEANVFGEKVIPELAKIPGIDAARPLLMGFSAGANMALVVWQQNPERLGGLILDEATPADLLKGGRTLLMPPKNPAVPHVPIFVLAGGKTGNAKAWEMLATPWRKVGVPLTYQTVPGRGHEWLFDAERKKALDHWLGEVAAGRLPGGGEVSEPAQKNDPTSPENGKTDVSSALKDIFTDTSPDFGPLSEAVPAETPKELRKNIRVAGYDSPAAHFHLLTPSNYDPQNAWPLFVVLHGSNGKADDLLPLFGKLIPAKGAVCVFPQALENKVLAWNYPDHCRYVFDVIRQTVEICRVDLTRIYLLGHSMGGGGAYVQGAVFGDLFAAVASLSGWYWTEASPPPAKEQRDWLKNMPLYVLHGEKDRNVPVGLSRKAEADLKALGNQRFIYRELAGVGHDVFTGQGPELVKLLNWLLAQQRATKPDMNAVKEKWRNWNGKFTGRS
jgi:predicted esterase